MHDLKKLASLDQCKCLLYKTLSDTSLCFEVHLAIVDIEHYSLPSVVGNCPVLITRARWSVLVLVQTVCV